MIGRDQRVLVANVHDGDRGFRLLAGGFGGLFRSGECSGLDRTVAATGSCTHATTRSVRLNGRIA
jgi:hypothetical protein